MAETLGFRNVSGDLVFAIVMLALIVSTLMGYVTDLVMRDIGLGVIGNGVLVFLGAGAVVVGWNAHVAPLASSDPVAVIGTAASGALAFLIGFALLRRLA